MRAIIPVCLASVILWAALAWCTVAVIEFTHPGHLRFSPRDLGASFACIVVAFGTAVMWVNLKLRDDRAR